MALKDFAYAYEKVRQDRQSLQTDPVGYEDDLNLYAYVANDPLNRADPTGRQAVTWRERMEEFFRPAEQARQDVGNAINETAESAAQAVRDDPGIIIDAVAIAADIATGPSGEGPAIAAGRRALTEGAEAAVRAVCCFVAGTLVDTEEGLRSIEDIAVGDLVLSRDEDTGETAYKPVTSVIPGHSRVLWRVTFSVHGEEQTATLGTTEDHPWRTADGRWLRTDELRPGEQITRATGEAAIVVAVENTGETVITYNFEVADWHTYFVGSLRVWVHNACPVPPRGRGSVPPAERDPQRRFSREQVGEMVDAQGGRCPQCEGPVSADDAVGHHVERHADGGPTTTDNGAALCPECHVDLHRRP